MSYLADCSDHLRSSLMEFSSSIALLDSLCGRYSSILHLYQPFTFYGWQTPKCKATHDRPARALPPGRLVRRTLEWFGADRCGKPTTGDYLNVSAPLIYFIIEGTNIWIKISAELSWE
jgi:hypothetical protein